MKLRINRSYKKENTIKERVKHTEGIISITRSFI